MIVNDENQKEYEDYCKEQQRKAAIAFAKAMGYDPTKILEIKIMAVLRTRSHDQMFMIDFPIEEGKDF